MATALLIPIKEPARVKTRLAGLLTLEERQRLVWAMFEDVCSAAAAARRPDAVFLVTSYERAIERARQLGVDAIAETGQESESASVDYASRLLGERGFDAVLRLPADVPLVRAADIDQLLAVDLAAPGALLVPSREGTGTNALLRTPPALFPSRFGPNSLALHREEAARAGIEVLLVENRRIALDIDDPHDVEAFLSAGSGTRAFIFLHEIGIKERFLK